MSYNLPNSLCGPNANGDVSFASLGSNYELNSGEGFVGYKSNLGTYYQNAFVIDTNSTVPTVFSSNGNPAFSLNSVGDLVVFGDVSKGTLNIGDTNECNFGGVFTPLGTAYFKQVNIGSTNNNGAALAPVANRHLQLSTGGGFATKFSVANTYTDINNYERLEIGWDSDVATIGPASAGTGSSRNLRLGNSATYLLMKPSDVKWELYTSGVKRVQFGSGGTSFGVSIFPISDSASTCGQDTLRWSNTYTDAITIGDGVDAVTIDSNGIVGNHVDLTPDSNSPVLELNADPSYSGDLLSVKKSDGTETIDITNQGAMRFHNTTGWAFTTEQAPRIGPNSGLSWYYGNGNAMRISRTVIMESNLSFADPAGGINSPVYRMRKTNSTGEFTFQKVTSGATFETIYKVTDTDEAIVEAKFAGIQQLKEKSDGESGGFYIWNQQDYDTSNYERLEVKWDTNVAKIESTAAGTGTQRDLEFEADAFVFRRGGTIRFEIDNQLGTAKFGSGVTVLPSANKNASLGVLTSRWYSIYTAGINTDVQTVTASSDTLAETDHVVLCDCTSNAITINLPAAQSGRQYHIKKIDSTANTVSIEPDDPGPELVDGAIVQTLSSQWDKITLVSDGSNWFTI